MSARLPRGVSGDQAIKALERRGWRVHRTKGSHYALEHPDFEPTSEQSVSGRISSSGGKIVRIEEYATREEALEAAGLSE